MNMDVRSLQDSPTRKQRNLRTLRFYAGISVLMGIWRIPLVVLLSYVATIPNLNEVPENVKSGLHFLIEI